MLYHLVQIIIFSCITILPILGSQPQRDNHPSIRPEQKRVHFAPATSSSVAPTTNQHVEQNPLRQLPHSGFNQERHGFTVTGVSQDGSHAQINFPRGMSLEFHLASMRNSSCRSVTIRGSQEVDRKVLMRAIYHEQTRVRHVDVKKTIESQSPCMQEIAASVLVNPTTGQPAYAVCVHRMINDKGEFRASSFIVFYPQAGYPYIVHVNGNSLKLMNRKRYSSPNLMASAIPCVARLLDELIVESPLSRASDVELSHRKLLPRVPDNTASSTAGSTDQSEWSDVA